MKPTIIMMVAANTIHPAIGAFVAITGPPL
jgi:hypothetical protein